MDSISEPRVRTLTKVELNQKKANMKKKLRNPQELEEDVTKMAKMLNDHQISLNVLNNYKESMRAETLVDQKRLANLERQLTNLQKWALIQQKVIEDFAEKLKELRALTEDNPRILISLTVPASQPGHDGEMN